ncbi:MAG: hypothetical protein AB7M12_01795 [Hyphomonadaceae bacterium]
MDDVFLSARISASRSICISPLPRQTYKEVGAQGLGGEFGYFVYEIDTSAMKGGIEVIAKAASLEAAQRLFELISNSIAADPA